MSDFQEGFFRDLRADLLLNESGSVLCGYFRAEKRQHYLVKLKRYCCELDGKYGPPQFSFDMLMKIPELKKKCARMELHAAETLSRAGQGRLAGELLEVLAHGETKETAGKRPRRSMGENACIEILCGYYDLLASDCAGDKLKGFLDVLDAKIRDSRGSAAAKRRAADALEHVRRNNPDRQSLPAALERAVEQVMDLYLYAEAVQFMYNAGYPLPSGEDGGDYAEGPREPESRTNARIKTIPLGLLDHYFAKRGMTGEDLTAINRMPPARVADSDLLQEKLEDVFAFACDNHLDRAVIPLLIDSSSGTGLYIIGETYLQGWQDQAANCRKIQDILDGRPCCYAIVRFLNLELEDAGTYFWAPYSLVDLIYGKGDADPEQVLFGDLDRALNIYRGQLSNSSQEILYENFRSENVVRLDWDAIPIDPQFLKYFQIEEDREEERFEEAKEHVMAEYRKRFSEQQKGGYQ